MMNSFKLILNADLTSRVDLVVFVNPSTIIRDPGTIYQDYDATAWYIFKFPTGTSTASKDYTPALRAYVAATTAGTIVNPATYLPVLSTQNNFTVTNVAGATTLNAVAPQTSVLTRIINNSGSKQRVGLADMSDQPSPYLVVNAEAAHKAEFVGSFSFAILPLSNYEKGMVFRGGVSGPWAEFSLATPVDGRIELDYDGTDFKLKCGNLAKFRQHPVEDEPFLLPSKEIEIDPVITVVTIAIVGAITDLAKHWLSTRLPTIPELAPNAQVTSITPQAITITYREQLSAVDKLRSAVNAQSAVYATMVGSQLNAFAKVSYFVTYI